MSGAKDLIVRAIPASTANDTVRRLHYSGSVVRNSQVHLGVFIGGRLEGAMQLGPPTDRRRMLPLVRDAKWEEIVELNRMAFSEALPRNSESRALGVMLRLLRKSVARFVVSFADATRCGDGTIYRAAGFVLTGVKRNQSLLRLPDGSTKSEVTIKTNSTEALPELGGRTFADVCRGGASIRRYMAESGAMPAAGWQCRYVGLTNRSDEARLTVRLRYEDLPAEARMYRGQCAPEASRDASADQAEEGGSTPTPALH